MSIVLWDAPQLRKILAVAALAATTFFIAQGAATAAAPGKAGVPPVPQGLFPAGITQDSAPEHILPCFLDLPYRNDGAVNASGQYTLFADQSKTFPTPGLNCSGYVLEASRFLLRKNFTLPEAIKDRLGDSGPGSPHGEDWDFGWDLIMNISEGFPRTLLMPGGVSQDPAGTTGFLRGYDIQTPATWKELPGRLQPGYLYLVSINVESRRKGYGLQHYHVGLIHVADTGEAWFYQTTGKGSQVNRRDLKTTAGQESFKQSFANSGNKRKMMLVLAVKLP